MGTIIVILIVIIVLMLLWFAVGYLFSNIAIHPRTLETQETYDIEIKEGVFEEEELKSWNGEEVRIKSPYGYELFGIFFKGKNADKAVIINHGITYTLYGSIKYARMFLKRGYNVLVYDNRNHGRSGGTNTTFGKYEKYDLKACTDWVFERLGSDCKVGIHGESLGAGICLQNAAIDDRLSFVIADCPYSDLSELLTTRLKIEFKLPTAPIVPMASFVTKMRCGMSFRDVSPIKDMDKIKTPIFYIHGLADDYIPNEMSVAMYNKKIGIKKLYLAPEAGHAKSYSVDKVEYERQVNEFLDEINM